MAKPKVLRDRRKTGEGAMKGWRTRRRNMRQRKRQAEDQQQMKQLALNLSEAIVRLQAEVERLNGLRNNLANDVARLHVENKQLRAEIELVSK